MLVSGYDILCSYCPSIALSPRFQDDQSPGCAECTTEANTMKQQTGVVAIECRVEKCGQKSQYVVDCLDSRVDCTQRRINGREIAGFNGFPGQRIEAIDRGKIENSVEHQRAQRKEYVSHCESVIASAEPIQIWGNRGGLINIGSNDLRQSPWGVRPRPV